MTAQESYLTLYKSYENALRDLGRDPRQVEADYETADPGKAARLRMCRLFRNYLAHEDDPGFLVASDRMTDFLTKEVFDLKVQNDSVKQHTKPAGSYIFEDTVRCGDVLAKLVSTKQIYVIRHSKTGYDICSLYDIVGLYMSSKMAKMAAVKSVRMKPVFVAPTDKFTDLDPSKIHICTADGTAGGKLVGIVKGL